MKSPRLISRLIASLALVCAVGGCAQTTPRQNSAMARGAVIGALLGAGAGAGIAAANTHGFLNKTDSAGIGILVGALVGAMLGAGVGYVIRNDSRQPPNP